MLAKRKEWENMRKTEKALVARCFSMMALQQVAITLESMRPMVSSPPIVVSQKFDLFQSNCALALFIEQYHTDENKDILCFLR